MARTNYVAKMKIDYFVVFHNLCVRITILVIPQEKVYSTASLVCHSAKNSVVLRYPYFTI
jgi:hypothetical protein